MASECLLVRAERPGWAGVAGWSDSQGGGVRVMQGAAASLAGERAGPGAGWSAAQEATTSCGQL